MTTRWTILAPALVVLAIGCNGSVKEFEQYGQDMCACTTRQCVLDVEKKYDELLNRPASFADKHLTSKDAEQRSIAALLAAEACKKKLDPPGPTCGGESGEQCPAGYRCVMKEPTYPDAQGRCVLIQSDNVK